MNEDHKKIEQQNPERETESKSEANPKPDAEQPLLSKRKSKTEPEHEPDKKSDAESETRPDAPSEFAQEGRAGANTGTETFRMEDEADQLCDEHGHRYLSPEAINAWRISGALGSVVYWLVPLGYGALSMGGELWPEWPAYFLGAGFLIYTILEGTVIPWVRWKRWRYHVDRNEIDLRRGLFIVTRTLIPIKRVQHVDTRQGPVYRQFGLASVTVTTAGDTHEIPALSEPVADELRKKISEYARIAREDL